MTNDQKAGAEKATIHPLAALTEAQFDNEIARSRRLMLAQQVYELTQLVGQQAQRMAELEAELAAHQQRDDATGDT